MNSFHQKSSKHSAEEEYTWERSEDRLDSIARTIFVESVSVKGRVTKIEGGGTNPPAKRYWPYVVSVVAFVVFYLLSRQAFEFVMATTEGPNAAKDLIKILAAVTAGIGACGTGLGLKRLQSSRPGGRMKRNS